MSSNKKILLNELNGLSNDRKCISKREKLWLESNRCRSCDIIMTLEPYKSNSLTIQHSNPRDYEGYKDDTTIWCYECNQKDNFWKQKHNILSIQDCIRITINCTKKLNGIFVVDGWVYFIVDGKINSKKFLYEWKLNLLKKWFKDVYLKRYFTKKQIISFDEYFESYVNGWFSFKHYHMGGGWYAYNQNPKLLEHWKYKSKEVLKEEEEEIFLFSCLINNYF